MTPDPTSYQTELVRVYLWLNELVLMPVEQMLEAAEKADNLAPFTDPTLWMRNGDKLREDMAAMRIVAHAKAAWQKLKEGRG